MSLHLKGYFYMSKTLFVLLAFLLLAVSGPAFAYIGPGAGISVIGSLLSILATIFIAIAAIVFWPMRKLLKRRKARRDALAINADVSESADAVNHNDDPRANT
jgi:type VI protein secretion system component VasK